MTSAADLDAIAPRLQRVATVVRNADSAPLTTYRVGGPIGVLVTVNSEACLADVSRALAGSPLPVAVVGRGSNLLVRDAGFAGVVVRLGPEFERVTWGPDGVVDAGGACALPMLARQTAAAGLRGLEFFVGIPGSVGGAVRMNAGGHGRETIDVLIDATIQRIGEPAPSIHRRDDLGLAFRDSNLHDDDVVISARFAAQLGEVDDARREIDEIVRWRRANQPGGQNCGSVFVNPDGDSAGRLIEASGLKGHRRGGASVSDKHANFIQADPGATAADVLELIDVVRDAVEDQCGVRMRSELRVLGDPPSTSPEMRA